MTKLKNFLRLSHLCYWGLCTFEHRMMTYLYISKVCFRPATDGRLFILRSFCAKKETTLWNEYFFLASLLLPCDTLVDEDFSRGKKLDLPKAQSSKESFSNCKINWYLPYLQLHCYRNFTHLSKIRPKSNIDTILTSRVHNGILLPKLFWPNVRKKCSSDPEKPLKFEAEGWEFAKFLRSLEQFIQTVKGQNNSGNRMLFNLFL